MPLTPRFEINQDPTKVWIDIDVPNIRINNETMEILLTDNNTVLHFYASPYLLKLNFYPHEFVTTTSTSSITDTADDDNDENDNGDGIISAQYDPIIQKVKIPLQKKIPNIEWPNLDLTARLIEPTTIPKKWLHSIVDENNNNNDSNNNANDEEPEREEGADDDKDNNNVDQNDNDNNNNNNNISNNNLSEIEASSSSSSSDGYGFGNMYQNLFIDYCRSGLAIEMFQHMPIEISPETTTQNERRKLRISKEDDDFDIDRYIQDLVTIEEDYLYPLVMDYIPFWKQKQKQKQQELSSSTATTIISSPSSYFTSDEQLQLSTIPYPLIPKKYFYDQVTTIAHVEINTNKIHHHHRENEQEQEQEECFKMIVNLLDLIVPFVYDHITTMGEPTVESAWTISTLSCSLSWLDPPYPTITTTTNERGSSNSNNDRDVIQDVVISISRRMLIYPYWRNWDFAVRIWTNTIQIFDLGIHEIIRSLLKLRSVLDKSEYYYLGNKLYVDPYLFWIQKNSTTTIFQQSLRRVVQGLNHIFVNNNNHSPTTNQLLKNQLGLGDLIQYEQDVFQVDDDEENDDDDDDDGDESEDASEATSSDDSSSSGDSTSDESDHDDDDDDEEEDNDDKNSTQNNISSSSRFDESLQRTIKDEDNSNMTCNINKGDETTQPSNTTVECISNSLLDCEIGHGMSLLKIVDDEQHAGNGQNDDGGGGACDVKESFIQERQSPVTNNSNNGDDQNSKPLIVEME